MNIQKRYPIETGQIEAVTILLVGCGGTGSFAALHLARLAWSAKQNGLPVRLIFVDPDSVEMKNVGRQNFCPAEVGQPKALALANRYSLAFGLTIEAYTNRFEKKILNNALGHRDTLLMVGAVDTPGARRDMARALEAIMKDGYYPWGRNWWLDAGNDADSGQVLIGNSPAREPVISLGRCVEVPLPSVQEPGLIMDSEKERLEIGPSSEENGLSCAELLAMDAQSLMINQAMADWIGVYAHRLVLVRNLDMMATYVDQASGSARSVAITGGQVAKIEHMDEIAETGQRIRQNPLFAEGEDDYWIVCPQCGADIVGGEDEIDGLVVEIVFCPECDWRMDAEEFEQIRLDLAEQNEMAVMEE